MRGDRSRVVVVAGLLLLAAAFAGAEEAGEKKESLGRADGETTLEFEEGSLSISNRVQILYSYDMPDTPSSTGTGGLVPSGPTEKDRGSFRIRRAKTELTGWIWT